MSYIFIGGSQRTGTSLLQQLLCQLPGTNPYVYESSYLRMLVSCYTEAREGFSLNHASYFGDPEGLREFNSGVVNAFLQYSAARLGHCDHLVLKEPHLTLFWPELFELVPEAMFIGMMRDPRDAIASMVEVGQRQKKLGQQYEFTNRNVAKLCDSFLSFYGPAFGSECQEFRARLAIVHYEKLVTDPVSMLEEISEFTGLPFSSIDPFAAPDMGHVKSETVGNSAHYSPWATDVSGKKVSASRIGNYRNVLTPSEIAIVEEKCGAFFEWFGYDQKAA